MTKKKTKGRIRQTRTSWQKTFDSYPGIIQPFSWSGILPEVLHISIALLEHPYDVVKSDLYKISNILNKKINQQRKFHFTLSHTLELIRQDLTILDEIEKTSFKNAFSLIIWFYHGYLKLEVERKPAEKGKLLLLGYKKILDGRSDQAILCKYMLLHYQYSGKPDPFGMYVFEKTEDILSGQNVSSVMAAFAPAIGISTNIDTKFCQDIWLYNYLIAPFMEPKDDTASEEQRFKEMKIQTLVEEFKTLYSEFRKVNLLLTYPRPIAEIHAGFISRISNLSLDIVDFVKMHKGEVAELLLRTLLENFIVASWLHKKKEPDLYQRFRDFSTGREKFFGEKLMEQSENPDFKNQGEKIVENAAKNAGVRDFDVASERGDIFDINLAQMATELWGEDNVYYFIYKRASEITHGQWRAIAKYHLNKSANPMHNGLLAYNDSNKQFAGLIPAFGCLLFASELMKTYLSDLEKEEMNELKDNVKNYREMILKEYMKYFNKYILKKEEYNK